LNDNLTKLINKKHKSSPLYIAYIKQYRILNKNQKDKVFT
jgi:hypothetical protein